MSTATIGFSRKNRNSSTQNKNATKQNHTLTGDLRLISGLLIASLALTLISLFWSAHILAAVTTDDPRLRYAVAAGHEVIARRAGVADEALLAMAGMGDDGYYAGLREKMGMDLT